MGNNLEVVPRRFRSAISDGGRQISLTNRDLSALPEWLGRLDALTRLDLNGNQLTTLPESLGQLTRLTTLNLNGNQLTTLPESLGQLTRLTTLNLNGNQLTTLPESLGHLTRLTTLDLSANRLTDLPESLRRLQGLTNLYLRGNQVCTLPEGLQDLILLTTLYLRGNALSELPEWLGHLARLTTLDFSGNQLTGLPEALGYLPVLTTLNLAGNQLTALPESLGQLTALTTLNVSGNQLTALPGSLGRLDRLTALSLGDNPLRSPLLEISEDGTAAVKAYLALVMDGAAELWTSKLLVVGEGAVGKTSLVKALTNQVHDPREPTTHGIRIVEVDLNHPDRPNVLMRLSSWDFGGQDIYHATHQFFLSDRSLFVLLWNARQGWEQAKLPYWLDIIKARAPNARVILVATHAEGRPIDLPFTDLKVTYPQIVGSASVDNSNGEGVDELRQKLADEAAGLPLMGSQWPASWVTGVETIRKCGLQHATPKKLQELLALAGVTDRSHQTYLLRALHLLGEILYFDEDEELRDTIILRPQWVNDYIAKVLDSPSVATRHGLLTRSHEQQLWSDLEPGLRDRFLLMMERFDLSYRITDDKTAASLVVERLPWDSPPYQQDWDAALGVRGAREIHLRYQLNTLPPGVPTWFIAREHRFTTSTHWRSGALLRYTADPRVFGLIRAERKNRTVDLAVRGPAPQLFFSVLQDGFESTLSRYKGLEITQLVPCICNHGNGTQAGRPCMHLYHYRPLLRRLEQGVPEVECELSFAKVSVAELLFGISPTTTEQLVRRLDMIDQRLSDFRAETAWAHREFLKALRQAQARAEAICPSIFTLAPASGRGHRPGIRRLELQLYCEQPGTFHATGHPPYTISQPTRWLVSIGPYLRVLLTVLKHVAPLTAPVLGLTSEYLANQLANETILMEELVSQLPETFAADQAQVGDLRNPQLDVDYRALYAALHELDPSESWAGLSRIYTPEGEVLWLCRDHAEQYGT